MNNLADQKTDDLSQHAIEDVAQWLQTLQADGWPTQDALDVCYLRALIQRAQTQPDTVRRHLLPKLRTKKEALVVQFASVQAIADADANAIGESHGAEGSVSALGALVQRLDQYRPERPDPSITGAVRLRKELHAVTTGRTTWSRLSAIQRVDRAMLQAPKNAGPLNSHRVALQTLAVMRDLSQDYLHRFIAFVDTLIALDPAQGIVRSPKKSVSLQRTSKSR